MCTECGCGLKGHREVIEVEQKILAANDHQAGHNRELLDREEVFGINLMSSPGAGKTTLLEKTIDSLDSRYSIAVIEGDLETERDAERIRAKGVPVCQVSTGQTCHLDAEMLHGALHDIPLDHVDLLFVENVGNLVCPAAYALGTHRNVVLLSVTEGDDKPAKYPTVFKVADLLLVTKIDLLPYTDFDMEKAIHEARVLNPTIEVLKLSAKASEGIDEWIDHLHQSISKQNLPGESS
jgi:hydrogenase nickel incorporation protein HypB